MPNIIPFLSYVLIATFTPGPNNIMSMVNAKEFGLKKTYRFILGVTCGFLLIMLLSSYFNLILFSLLPKIKEIMSIAGAVYMAFLAFKVLTPKTKAGNDTRTNTFIAGLSLQFINPKVILYGITVISTFVVPYYRSNAGLILFSMFLALVGFLSTSCWACFGSIFQNFLRKHYRLFNLCMASLLIFCAISIFFHR